MEDKLRQFYNEQAGDYDAEQEAYSFVRVPEQKIALAAIGKTVQKHHSVLEIGAGTGRFTLQIATWVKEVTAVDFSGLMLEQMARKMREQEIANIRQYCGGFMDFDLSGQYDMIVSFSALEYILQKEALFAKIGKLLVPGGHLIVTTTHQTFFRWWGRIGNYFRQGIWMDAYSKPEMKRLLAVNRIELIKMEDLCLKSYFSKGILLFVHATKQI